VEIWAREKTEKGGRKLMEAFCPFYPNTELVERMKALLSQSSQFSLGRCWGVSNIAGLCRQPDWRGFSFMLFDRESFVTSLTTLKCFLSFGGLKAFLLCFNIIYPLCTQE
jgi:hypothetical protein